MDAADAVAAVDDVAVADVIEFEADVEWRWESKLRRVQSMAK